jgi:hypothetical protein
MIPKIIIPCLAALVGCAFGQTPETWTAFDCNEGAVPFAINTPDPSDVFQSPINAVIIEEIICDGKLLQPESSGVHVHGLPADIIKNTSKHLVYRFGFSILSKVFVGPNGESYNAVSYEIPRDVRLLEIKYRIRYPSGNISELQLLRAFMCEPPMPVPPLPPRKINPANQPKQR